MAVHRWESPLLHRCGDYWLGSEAAPAALRFQRPLESHFHVSQLLALTLLSRRPVEVRPTGYMLMVFAMVLAQLLAPREAGRVASHLPPPTASVHHKVLAVAVPPWPHLLLVCHPLASGLALLLP